MKKTTQSPQFSLLCSSFLCRPAPGLSPRKTSVLRLSDSSDEEPDDEEPEEPTPKNRSELEIVNDDIEEAKSTLVQYVKWLAESKVTHADVTEARQTYNLLLAERSRLKASSSAPSCATGVV